MVSQLEETQLNISSYFHWDLLLLDNLKPAFDGVPTLKVAGYLTRCLQRLFVIFSRHSSTKTWPHCLLIPFISLFLNSLLFQNLLCRTRIKRINIFMAYQRRISTHNCCYTTIVIAINIHTAGPFTDISNHVVAAAPSTTIYIAITAISASTIVPAHALDHQTRA